MNKNVITVKTAFSTGLFLGGVVLNTPSLGAEIDYYTSSSQFSYIVSNMEDAIVQPSVSFDCNPETEISMITQIDEDILNTFAKSLLKGMKNLDADISQWVDDNFWDLV